MGMDYAEDPFNMSMFNNSRCHSKWVCFQIPNTHTSGRFHIRVAPREEYPLYGIRLLWKTIRGASWETEIVYHA